MGTNYKLRRPHCDHCRQTPAPEHICKSFHTWQGIFTWDDQGEPQPIVTTYAGWRARIASAVADEGAWIEDEYGRRVDPGWFFASAEAMPADQRRRQYDALRSGWPHRIGSPAPDRDWLDPDGFTFSGSDFS